MNRGWWLVIGFAAVCLLYATWERWWPPEIRRRRRLLRGTGHHQDPDEQPFMLDPPE